MSFGVFGIDAGIARDVNLNGEKMKLIDREAIIAKRQALIRQGLKPAFIGYDSAYRMKERQNVCRMPHVVSTTYHSPLTSRVYFSVFCKGEKRGVQNKR